jgi:carbon storage regulator
MLVLTRRIGEQIVIDGAIVIQVLQAQGNKVRIGFLAPRSVKIRRQELLIRDDSEEEGNARSTGSAGPRLGGTTHP